MSDGRSQGWCFTINNPTDEDDLTPLKDVSRYGVAGLEVGDEGTTHIQGFIYFATKRSLSQMKKLLPRAHLEVMRGSWEQASDYCKKENNFHEWGEPPMSKKRKGELGKEFWEEQLSLAKQGRIEECSPRLQITHDQALSRIAAKYAPLPAELDVSDNHHQWFYGPTGTGKSRRARDLYSPLYLKGCNKWWSRYKDEKNVLIEDFDKRHEMLGHFLKLWADRYPFAAESKGGELTIRPNLIIVTSNWHPKEIWPNEPETLDPILRRFKVTQFQ